MTRTSTSEKQGGLYKQTVKQMPEAYYSGDRPNANLRRFVEEHLRERPYDPEADDYDVPTFEKPIETPRSTAIFNMHTYWSKKPHDAIRQYVRHYTEEGDLVLDPFCGSGGTALAALMEGRKAVAIDRSPAATFITKNYCTPVDAEELKAAFEGLKRRVAPEIGWLYETRCDRCEGEATTGYTVYSQVFRCGRCMERVALFDCVELEGQTAKGQPKKVSACPLCYKRGLVEEISTRDEKLGAIPVLVSYLCESGCKPARGVRRHDDEDERRREYFERYDLGKLREIESREIPHWYPKHKMMNVEDDSEPWGVEWREGRNFRSVDALFTKRNLWALASTLEGIESASRCRDALLFTFTSILMKSSRMMAHNSDGIGRIKKGTYYIPQILHDIHVWQFMEEAIGDMILGYRSMIGINDELLISTSDARSLDIANSSIDYIFTDPPYAEKVQYGELNFIWESWLRLDTNWHGDEIIVNLVRGKSEQEWEEMMKRAMAECYRVLKPGRAISVCYHDTSEGTWSLLQDMMAEAGFVVEKTASVLYIESKAKTTNQYFADKVNKRDLVINFRKPKAGEAAAESIITGREDKTTFNEKIRLVIRDYLTSNPGETKDHIFDEVVSRMVRAGSMEAHDFNELLAQVAEEVREPFSGSSLYGRGQSGSSVREAGRWYLKETEMAVVDFAESAKEDAAAASIKSFITQYLAKHRGAEGVHYSDIFEHFVYTVKDKPRRPLAEWLLDYFFKTDEGTYRLPASAEEEELKKQGRASGTNRRIKRYIAYLQQGVAVPAKERPNDATLAEWIRNAKRSGMYEAGKILYEKGGLNLDNLPEDLMVKVEEDYQVCVRQLARAGNQPRAARKTGKKAK